MSQLVPQSKIGAGVYVYVWSWGYTGTDGVDYYGLSAINSFVTNAPSSSTPGLTLAQAYSIDQKIDDGLPQSRNITAQYLNFNPPWGPPLSHWSSGQAGVTDGGNSGSPNYGPTTAATSGSATTCYDNANLGGPTQQYSVKQNDGAGVNCALSFRFQ